MISASKRAGFSLVEMMVSVVILVLLMAVILSITSQTSQLLHTTNSKITSFQDARAAFDALTHNLAQATLNHYYDYYDVNWNPRTPSSTGFVPAYYGRYSDLHFVCGPVDTLFSSGLLGTKQSHAVFFQAPLGFVNDTTTYAQSNSLINALGYYVEFSDNQSSSALPAFLQTTSTLNQKRFRLMQWLQPSEKFQLYDSTLMSANPTSWYTTLTTNKDQCHVMADNVVALILQPQSTPGDTVLAPNYAYDSAPATYDSLRSHLLPPIIQVTMVAIDRDSAARLYQRYQSTEPPLYPASLFKTAASYASDLTTLEQSLQGGYGGPKLNYRVFTTTINTRDYK
jgi:uncharacterized protein (TIGR02599 family)